MEPKSVIWSQSLEPESVPGSQSVELKSVHGNQIFAGNIDKFRTVINMKSTST